MEVGKWALHTFVRYVCFLQIQRCFGMFSSLCFLHLDLWPHFWGTCSLQSNWFDQLALPQDCQEAETCTDSTDQQSERSEPSVIHSKGGVCNGAAEMNKKIKLSPSEWWQEPAHVPCFKWLRTRLTGEMLVDFAGPRVEWSLFSSLKDVQIQRHGTHDVKEAGTNSASNSLM